MEKTSQKTSSRIRRRTRIRARIFGTALCPRLAVFRSNRYVYAQLVDDDAGKTVATADSRSASGGSARERAASVGKAVARAAKSAGIESIVFDRGGFQYQGVIAALADGARKEGLTF